VTGVLLRSALLGPLSLPAGGLIVEVKPGSSLAAVAAKLEAEGVVSQPLVFRAVARVLGADQRIRAGEYRLLPQLNLLQLLEQLQSGDTVRYLVTLPEGIRLRDAIDLLQESDGIDALLQGASDPRLLRLVEGAEGAVSAEGFFLPETYQYERGATDLQILEQAHRLAREELAAAWATRADELPYRSPYEALIMASIIEKETGLSEERGQIAGVFVRRLRRGIRLQTDPTVIYGLGEDFDGNLTRAHLRDSMNPYNTYRHHGLPPTPIALPGRAALGAALNPELGDSLYFVARGDGSHVFSATLEEHERAVREFQLRRRDDYRSSPPR
jgi:UPF0755 protein